MCGVFVFLGGLCLENRFNTRIPFLKDKVKDLPLLPGVYIMKDSKGTIIYIGKAKKLKNRVSSYFRSIDKHTPKVYKMVSNVYDFDYIVTDSEFEALVLECSLIKLHMPKYNILLKDDKGYHYIKVSDEPYPRITSEKQKIGNGTFFGPYVSSFVAKQTADQIVKAFGLPVCNRKFPQDIKKERPCLYYHIKQCIAPCLGNISAAEYNEVVNQAVMCIREGSSESVKKLEELMNTAAENLEFEKAAALRDRIAAIKKVSESQKVILSGNKDIDAVGFSQRGLTLCAVVLRFRKSKLVDKADFVFEDVTDIAEAKTDFLIRYYDNANDLPSRVVLGEPVDESEMIEKYITKKSGKALKVAFVSRGEYQKIAAMAGENAAQRLSEERNMSLRDVTALAELGKAMGLSKSPEYIEVYDISNFGETTAVAGMVVFEDGRPLKSAYRKFSIKDIIGQNDYGCMQEVIRRRLARYHEEKKSGTGFGRLPDLILVDGGQAHVNAVSSTVKENGFDIPVFGLVKNSRHRTRAISSSGGEITLNPSSEGFKMITRMQDEVHRFAITYSRKKHASTSFKSSLTEIEGIGPARAKALLKHFKTVSAIKQASTEELAKVDGMTEKTAKAVYDYYHKP